MIAHKRECKGITENLAEDGSDNEDDDEEEDEGEDGFQRNIFHKIDQLFGID